MIGDWLCKQLLKSAWVCRVLGIKSPSEMVNKAFDDAMMSDSFFAQVKVLDEILDETNKRTELVNNVVESGLVECLGKMSDDDMETMIKALTHGEDDCNS